MARAARGYLPCFSRYLEKEFPLDAVFDDHTIVDKLKIFLKEIVTTNVMNDLKVAGVSGDIQPIRKNSKEENRLSSICGFSEGQLYRLDYGNNKNRILFGIDTQTRYCYIFAVDVTHQTFSGKNRKY
jgi:hypothetical protein